MIEKSLPALPTAKPRRRISRLAIIAIIGIVAIVTGLGVRNSGWVRERHLKALSLEELALAIHDSPNDPLTFLYYGSALLKAGNAEGAETAFKRAVRLDPTLSKARLGLGSALLRKGDLQGAITTLQEAVKNDPKDTAAYLGLAQAFYRAGSPRSATDPLKKIVELQPHNAIAWFNLGKIYGEAHQSDQAYDALQKAVKIDPNQADYWRNLGQVARHYSKLDEAENCYKRAVKLNPNDPVTYYWLGQLYAQMGDTPKLNGWAEQAFLSAVQRDPNMPEAYFELGQLYERRGNYQLAANNFQRARKLDLADDRSLYHLGQCLVKLGDTEEGKKLIAGSQALSGAKREIENLENRIKAEPKTRSLRLRMARIYRKYGNHDDALNQYLVYQRMGPSDGEVQREADAYVQELKRQGALPANAPNSLQDAGGPGAR